MIAGIHHVMKADPPSLILSGVNRGNNSAENVLYSGTIGAALEGALQGVPLLRSRNIWVLSQKCLTHLIHQLLMG